jgi:hypothetical protein
VQRPPPARTTSTVAPAARPRRSRAVRHQHAVRAFRACNLEKCGQACGSACGFNNRGVRAVPEWELLRPGAHVCVDAAWQHLRDRHRYARKCARIPAYTRCSIVWARARAIRAAPGPARAARAERAARPRAAPRRGCERG